MPKRFVLSTKGVDAVEDLLVAIEDFQDAMGTVQPEGKAAEILALVQECSGRINDVMEA